MAYGSFWSEDALLAWASGRLLPLAMLAGSVLLTGRRSAAACFATLQRSPVRFWLGALLYVAGRLLTQMRFAPS